MPGVGIRWELAMNLEPRHPLLCPKQWPQLWIPPVDQLGKNISVALEFNRHGIIDTGLGRIGKSTSIALLAGSTRWCPYRFVWLQTIAGKARAPSEGYFFDNMRLTAKLKVRESSSTFGVHHLANYLCAWADEEEADFIVVSIDDGNRMFHEDWDHLVTLDSQIAARGQRLFALAMMQSDADQSSVPKFDKERHPSQVTGRFTADETVHFGLIGADEIRIALKELASQVWNGKTYEEHFAGHAVECGWHLEQQAQDYLTAVENVRAKHSLPVVEPLAMSNFMPSAYYLLVRIAGENRRFERFTIAQLEEALELSGLFQLELSRRPKDKR